MKKLILFFIIISGLVSCKEKSIDCGDPFSTECQLLIIDKNNTPLVGEKYMFDSISLKVENKNIHLSNYNGEIIFNYSGLEIYNNMDYILKLDSEDCDTINLFIRKFQNDCWTGYSVDTFLYNNKIIESLTLNRFEVIK